MAPPFWHLLALGLGLACAPIVAVYGYRRTSGRWLFWVVVGCFFLPPLGVAGITGCQYLAGTARPGRVLVPPERRFRHPGPGRGNLHPRYRAFTRDSGAHWKTLWQVVADPIEAYVIELLFAWVGPMPGSYHGNYPDADEARRALLASDLSISEDDLRLPIRIGAVSYHLKAETLRSLSSDPMAPGEKLAIAPVGEDCLVIGFWGAHHYHVELVNVGGIGWFARYRFGENEQPLPHH